MGSRPTRQQKLDEKEQLRRVREARAGLDANEQLAALPRTRSGALRVGCIAWSSRPRRAPRMMVATLEASLAATAANRDADLILCAGAIWRGRDEAARQALMRASNEIPVLGEWEADGPLDGRGWWLATTNGWLRVREQQHFEAADEVRSEAQYVLDEFNRGYGVIRFTGCDTALVLLICGEVRLLCDDARSSIIRYDIANRVVPDVFTERWALLHPAHRPYGAQNRMAGFGIVGPVARVVQVPLLELITRENVRGRPERTRHAEAAFHAGNWDTRFAWSLDVAVRRYRARSPVVGPLDERLPRARFVRYAEFTL
jgi:hypothetical protein